MAPVEKAAGRRHTGTACVSGILPYIRCCHSCTQKQLSAAGAEPAELSTNHLWQAAPWQCIRSVIDQALEPIGHTHLFMMTEHDDLHAERMASRRFAFVVHGNTVRICCTAQDMLELFVRNSAEAFCTADMRWQ